MPSSTPPHDPFPGRLRAARGLRDINQVELAERAGLPQSTISLFESGARKPSFDNLRRLGDALQVSVDYLLGRVDEPEGTSSGATVLFRQLENLDAHGRRAVESMIEALARKGNKPAGGE